MDDFSFFDLNLFVFLLIEFHCIFSISCKRIPYYVYYYCVVREVNVLVLGKGLVLLSANGCRFEINMLLFSDDTALGLTQRRSCVDWRVSL